MDPRAWNTSEVLSSGRIYSQAEAVRTSGFGFSSVDGWSNLDPFPTGRFVPWMVLCSCLCQHIPAPLCNTLSNSFKTSWQGFAHLLVDSPPDMTKKMIFHKIPGGKGQAEAGILA